MENLKLYKVHNHYIKYLHSVDSKVQFNKDARRPYVGVVFTFRRFKYFVPMESPKPNHANIKSGKHLLKIESGKYGILGFNNMIPVHKDALVKFNIKDEQDIKYRTLLERQVKSINNMKADVLNHAQMTYFDVIDNKNKFLVGISCNFKKLESACKSYNKDYKPSKNKSK